MSWLFFSHTITLSKLKAEIPKQHNPLVKCISLLGGSEQITFKIKTEECHSVSKPIWILNPSQSNHKVISAFFLESLLIQIVSCISLPLSPHKLKTDPGCRSGNLLKTNCIMFYFHCALK